MWFTLNPVEHNTLGNRVKNLCEKAGIEGHYTNHSLRVTTATRGLEKGIAEKYVMERTGHRDARSLHRYQRPKVQQKIETSRAFDLSSSHEESHLDYVEASDIKNVIDCSTKEEEIDTLNAKDKVKLCKNEKSETTRCGFNNNCTFFVQHDFLA